MNLIDLVPGFIRRRISHRPQLMEAADNAGWLFIDRGVRLGVGLVVGVWLARYLGPEQFGKLSFANALVGLFGAFAALGLNRIVVRDIARDPGCANATLGTAVLLQLLGAAAGYAALIFTIAWLRPEDSLSRLLVAVMGFGLFFQARSAARYWFESQLQSRYNVWVENSVFLLLAAVKAVLILAGAPLLAFAWVALVEGALAALALFVVYARATGQLRRWRATRARARTLVAAGWPMLLSGLAVMLQSRVDQIMLGDMVGDFAVGQYAVAHRLIETFTFVPVIIASSLAPAIARARQADRLRFEAHMRDVYRAMMLAFVVVAVPIYLFSSDVVRMLFGAQYQGAATLLQLMVLRLFFVNFSVAKNLFITNENLFKYALLCSAAGAAANVLLNWLLIPHFGPQGAVAASLASLFVTVFLVDAFSVAATIRGNLRSMLQAMINPLRFGR